MLNRKKLFLFDIDGTLSVGDTLFNGSARLLQYIEEIGGKAVYITNNSTKSCADYVKKFDRWGLRTCADQFVTAGLLTRLYLQKHHGSDQIFVLGTASFVRELKEAGLCVTQELSPGVRCLVAAFDSELTYEKLKKACEILFTTEVDYLATNPDLRCPAPFGFIPDCGAICGMLRDTTGREPVYLGKPSAEVVRLCLERTGFSPEETLVVGDRLYTDIACGINAGVDTCAVLTGETDLEEIARSQWKPAYCFPDVKDLLEACRAGG